MNNVKTLNVKISDIFPYCLVLVLSSALCFGFCKFVVDKEIDKDISVTKSISASILIAEHYMEGNLKCATTALHMHLKHNPMPKKKQDLWDLRDSLGVTALSIWDKNAKLKYTTTSVLENDPEFWKNHVSTCPRDLSTRVLKKEAIEVFPLSRSINEDENYGDTYSDSCLAHWSKESNVFANAYLSVDGISDILADSCKNFGGIDGVVLSSPSGRIIMDSNSPRELTREKIDLVIESYSNKPIVQRDMSTITVSIPFGGLKSNCPLLKSDSGQFAGAANDKGQYFYVMNVIFDKTDLNKEISMIIVIFVALTLFVCIAMYYINKSSAQSSQLADISEKTADKVTHLCNTRLGEVRRYVTKIVSDSMRVKNMNKDLPAEMVELLDKAFKKVDERDIKNLNNDAETGIKNIESDNNK